MKEPLKPFEYNKAPGRQWIIVIWNTNVVGYILQQNIYPDEIIYGKTLGPSAKTFTSKEEAHQFALFAKFDRDYNFAVIDFVQEMKRLISTNNIPIMQDQYYCRITCEDLQGNKLYIRYDQQTQQLFPDEDWRSTFMDIETRAKFVMDKISKEKQDKYKNYKLERI